MNVLGKTPQSCNNLGKDSCLLTYMMQKHEGRDLGAVLRRWLSPSDKSPKVAEKKGRTRIITCRRTKAVYCKAESSQSKQVILRRENCVV